MTNLEWILALLAGWLGIGVLGLVFLRNLRFVAFTLFPIGGVIGIAVCVLAIGALAAKPETAVLGMGLPQLPFHVRLDSLSAFFLAVIGGVGACISFYSAGYFRPGEGTPPGMMCLEYFVFMASMCMVVLADDAYCFMVMWETMALSSFFLVTANHRDAATRQAGYLYLVVAHVGAIAILLCFGVLQAGTGDYTFAGLRAQQLTPFWASAAFFLATLGFGAKAGLLPLHVWLPEAHPAAPSPVSALMSGVMLKTAIYGLLRVMFDILHQPMGWWGLLLLGLGLATALFGVIYSTVQTDMKRLLAYSSIENIGLLFVGIGLAALFKFYHMDVLSVIALTASLFHIIGHAVFKSLLFLGTGTVLHATGERNLGKLGGLIRQMPWTGWLVLIGVLAGSGLPPFSGFVSEWMLLQSFLFTTGLPDSFLKMLIPVAAALITLIAALAGFTMVKFFGVIFLGQPREPKLEQAHDAGVFEKLSFVALAAMTIALGLFPVAVIAALDPVTRMLMGAGLGDAVAVHGWMVLAPISLDRASYSPIGFFAIVALAILVTFVLVRAIYHGRVRRAPPWDCGFPYQNGRMQDTAEGFGQPIRRIFEPIFRMTREVPSPFDTKPHYKIVIEDHFWHWIYLPIAHGVNSVAKVIGKVQTGRISMYLLYNFLALMALLLVVKL